MDRANTPINSILEQAAHIVRRKKETTGTLEPTESYKREQTKELITFAYSNDLWISLSELNVEFLSKGGENEVYTGDKDDVVVKLNNFEYAGDDLENFFIRINAHNKFFGNVPYQMIGFSYNSQQEFCAVLIQPYILAEREATEDDGYAAIQHTLAEGRVPTPRHNLCIGIFGQFGLRDQLHFKRKECLHLFQITGIIGRGGRHVSGFIIPSAEKSALQTPFH